MEKTKTDLNDAVAPKEILEYFEAKYETPDIVSPKTIYNWLRRLKIDCIQPRPSRNSDIRYAKSDVLKLEKAKSHRLKALQYKNKQKEEYEKRAELEREKFKTYYDKLSDHKEQEDLAPYKERAEQIIQGDMLRMCFEKLFPEISFDRHELAKNLKVVDVKDIEDFAKQDEGLSSEYIKNKLYIKKQSN